MNDKWTSMLERIQSGGDMLPAEVLNSLAPQILQDLAFIFGLTRHGPCNLESNVSA